ncbi:helix-turn-helix domain-containing protein [Candidatus Woesearchaeota archaeon]|jgi:predicted DNA-binding transcriptional regulator AlpA|nr:helix-turn-helix domain-containing protein [Candidatus Woesearchaeota archaeon]
MIEELLNTRQASKILGLDYKSLSNSRNTGTGPKISYIKIGRVVRYKLSELESYIESHTYSHTGEPKIDNSTI